MGDGDDLTYSSVGIGSAKGVGIFSLIYVTFPFLAVASMGFLLAPSLSKFIAASFNSSSTCYTVVFVYF